MEYPRRCITDLPISSCTEVFDSDGGGEFFDRLTHQLFYRQLDHDSSSNRPFCNLGRRGGLPPLLSGQRGIWLTPPVPPRSRVRDGRSAAHLVSATVLGPVQCPVRRLHHFFGCRVSAVALGDAYADCDRQVFSWAAACLRLRRPLVRTSTAADGKRLLLDGLTGGL